MGAGKFRSGPLFLVAVGMGFIFFLEFLGLFQGFNQYAYDLFFRLRGPKNPGNRVVIAAIDEKTLHDLGKWPIERSYYARFLAVAASARAVCFDLVFSEPDFKDRVLGEAIARHGKVVLPVYLDNRPERVNPLGLLAPRAIGHVHVEHDVDGVTRRIFRTLLFDHVSLPSMATTLYRLLKEKDTPGRADRLEPAESRPGKIIQRDPMWINYYGPPGTFPQISFSDIISGRYKEGFFAKKIVLVGVTAIGIESESPTPFSQTGKGMSGVEVQANAIANLLNNDTVMTVDSLWIWLIVLAISVCAFFVFASTNEKESIFLWIVIVVVVGLAVFLAFVLRNIWFEPALLCATITYACGAAYALRLDDAVKRLGEEYSKVLANLRWRPEKEALGLRKKSFLSLFSSDDIDNRIKMLGRITEQLLFEKSLADATLSSGIYGIILFDPPGRLIIANDRAKKIFADLGRQIVEDLEEFILALLPDLIDEERPQSPADLLKKTENTISFTIAVPNPHQVYIKMDVGSVMLKEGRYYLFVFSDVTKLKELEQRKSEVVSIVSHELKQPLQVILGYGQLLSIGPPGKKDEYAAKIVHETGRMNTLINTFLSIARLESGKQQMNRTDVDLGHVISYVAGEIGPIAAGKGIAIRSELSALDLKLRCDQDLLVQSLLNLLENGIKYSPRDREVLIKVFEEKTVLKISVADKGYGIAPAEIPHIFDKFYRIRTEDNQGVSGSGLGLAFVKEAVAAIGGAISVESRPGDGSTFTIAFTKTTQ